MTFRIGDTVQTPRYVGIVHDLRNGPQGDPEFEVRRLGGPAETEADFFRTDELVPASMSEIDNNQPVYLNGGIGRVIQQCGDEYVVEVIRPRRCGMAWRHVYKVAAWQLALGNS